MMLQSSQIKSIIYRMGTWNIITSRNREIELVREMERNDLDVLGISETKARGNGMKEIDGAKYIFAGVVEGRAKGGVGIVVRNRVANCIKSWRCVSERCIAARLRIEGKWLTIVQVYAPTDDRDPSIKDDFYGDLQMAINRTPRGDKLIVLGDFNARVGNNIELWNGIIGRHGEGVENDSGRRRLRFTAENDFKVMNTHFEHKDIHKFTWKCPGRGLQSIIDYILVRGNQRKDVNDVRVIRGAEIGSDHYLVLMKVKLVGKGQIYKENPSSQLRTERLRKEEGVMKYRNLLMRRLRRAWYSVENDAELAWNVLKKAITESVEEVCGRRKCRKKKRTRWWNREVEGAVKRKKEAFSRWLEVKSIEAKEEYRKAKRKASHVIRTAKNDEWRRLGEELEEDYQRGQGRFWMRIRSATKRSQQMGTVCSESGQMVCEKEEVINRWKEYFESLLKGDTSEVQAVKRVEHSKVVHNDEEISLEEVYASIRGLKNRKSPGVCSITGEMLKLGGLV